MGRLSEKVRIGIGLLGNTSHGLDKLIQLLPALGFGRLDHEGPLNDQGKSNGGGVEAIIHQAFGEVHHRNVVSGLPLAREYHFVKDGFVIGQLVNVPQMVLDVVGMQNRHLAGLPEPFGPIGQDIGQRTHQSQEVSVKGLDPADGARTVMIKRVTPVIAPLHGRGGQEGFQHPFDRHGAGARPAASVRRGEGLVQIDVEDIRSEVSRPCNPHQGVEVGSIHVDQPSPFVHDPGNAHDVLLEDSQRVGVGQHQGRDLVVHGTVQPVEIDASTVVRFQGLNLVAGNDRAGGVGSVGGVRDQNPSPGIAP